jgi:hypothetical protein
MKTISISHFAIYYLFAFVADDDHDYDHDNGGNDMTVIFMKNE